MANSPGFHSYSQLLIIIFIIFFLHPPIINCLEGKRIFEININPFNINFKPKFPSPIGKGQIYSLSKDPDDVHFYFFPNPRDASHKKEIIYNDTLSLFNSGFDPNLTTIFITHGFRSNLSSDMPQTLKNAFLDAIANEIIPNCNIIVLSWGKLSTPLPPEVTASLYTLATLNVPVVGKRLADFILFLQRRYQLPLQNVHLIGHSLGAHVSGLAGRNIFIKSDQKVGRISGLDPAGPDFFPRMPSRNLMKDNAMFVDVIHTNAGVLGDFTNDGHADFYPNGGVAQPGCHEGDRNTLQTLGRCSHWYAYQIYAASLKKSFPACECSAIKVSYPLGLCSVKCSEPVTLGFNCPSRTRGEFYLTPPNPP